MTTGQLLNCVLFQKEHEKKQNRDFRINVPLPDDVIDNDWVRVVQQARQFHGNIRELHAWTAKDLRFGLVKYFIS